MIKNFLEIPKTDIIYSDEYFFIINDAFPVSPGHLLIISNRICENYFDLTMTEKQHLPKAIELAKQIIEEKYSPDGYNIGINCGDVAGQSILHFHCHLIPRYKGDMKNPKGGIRHCVQGKGYYGKEEISNPNLF